MELVDGLYVVIVDFGVGSWFVGWLAMEALLVVVVVSVIPILEYACTSAWTYIHTSPHTTCTSLTFAMSCLISHPLKRLSNAS